MTTGTSGVETPALAPTLNIPSSFSTPAVNGELRFANAVGTGTDIVTVVLAVRGGPTGAAPTLSSALGNGVANDVTVSGNATSTLTLTGTASAVSTYLTASNRILFNGTASARSERVPFTCVLPANVPQPAPVVMFGHGYGSSRFDFLGFAWALNRVGMAACAFDYPGHGPTVSADQEEIGRAHV